MSEETMISTERGDKLFCRIWHPVKKPKAAVLISHGYAEHSGRYEHVAARLNGAGYAVYASDLQGHGKTPGTRAYVKSFKLWVQDTNDVLNSIRKAEGPGLPVFVLGHSLGSTIALHFASEHQDTLKGIVLSGAGVGYADITPSREGQIKMASKLAPKKMMSAEFDASRLSHDQEVVKAYQEDPMIFAGTGSLSLLKAMVDSMSDIKERAKVLKLPVLVQAGSDDKLVHGHQELFDSFTGVADKTLKVYDGFYHEIYNETADRRKVALDDLVSWLDKHV